MRQALLVLFFSWLAGAQSTEGLSASASRTVTFTADEAAFTMVAATTLDGTQQQVKQALQDAGFPNPTVVAVAVGSNNAVFQAIGPNQPQPAAQILYQVTVTIPAGSVKDAAKNLEALRAKLPTTLSSLQYSVSLNASQATLDAMRQVVLPQLVAEAQKKAQALAAAAGVKLGPIKAISESANGVYAIAGIRSGDFSALLLGAPLLAAGSGSQYTYLVNVTFGTIQ